MKGFPHPDGHVRDTRSLDEVVRPIFDDVPGWVLNEAQWYSDTFCMLTFSRDGQEFKVFVAPKETNSDAFIETSRFKLGYNEECPDQAGLDLIRHLAKVLETLDPGAQDALARYLASHTTDSLSERYDNPRSAGVVEGIRDTVLRITTHCNERCPFCFVNPEDAALDEASTKEAIDRIASSGGREVAFGGGEPFLSPFLPEVVRYARSRGLYVTVQSNGLLGADEGFWRRFCDSLGNLILPNAILFSFHTQFPDRLPAITGRAGTLDVKIETIRRAIRLGIVVNLNFVVSTLNVDEAALLPSFVNRTFNNKDIGLVFSVVEPCRRVMERPELIPSVAVLRQALTAALKACLEEGITALVPDTCGVPPCLAPEYHWLFLTSRRPIEVTESAMEGRVKPAHCSQCVMDRTCIGLWKEFAETEGFDSLEPITGYRMLTEREELLRAESIC